MDEALSQTFTGTIDPGAGTAAARGGQTYTSLWGEAVESGAPLTMMGFRAGLGQS